MTPAESRALLRAAGLTISDLAATAQALGDERTPDAILRGLQRALSRDHAQLPWYAAWIVRREVEAATSMRPAGLEPATKPL